VKFYINCQRRSLASYSFSASVDDDGGDDDDDDDDYLSN